MPRKRYTDKTWLTLPAIPQVEAVDLIEQRKRLYKQIRNEVIQGKRNVSELAEFEYWRF